MSCRNSLTVKEYLLFCIYTRLYVFKILLDEQGEESFNSYSLPEVCKQGITLHNVFKCIRCQSVRSAAVMYQTGKLVRAFKQLAISLVSFACVCLKGPLCWGKETPSNKSILQSNYYNLSAYLHYSIHCESMWVKSCDDESDPVTFAAGTCCLQRCLCYL